MKNDFTAKIVTLNEVYSLTHKLATQIMNSSVPFDSVIAIARGGMLPARLICDFLNIHQLSSIQIKHYGSGAEELDEVEITDPLNINIDRKNVLLIDDVNDTGKTMTAAIEHIQSRNPQVLKTAVLHEKSHTIKNADFSVETLKKWKWLIYQWAVTEDVLKFLIKDEKLAESNEVIQSHLAEKYKLHADPELLDKIMQMRDNYTPDS